MRLEAILFFRKGPKIPENYPIARCIELLGAHAGPEARDRAIHKLYRATQTVMEQFGQHISADARFAEFKGSLQPEQAALIAEKTREVGASIRRQAPLSNPDAFALDDMAFMFVAASLHARAGVAWIEEREVKFIDHMIAASEKIAADLADNGFSWEDYLTRPYPAPHRARPPH